MTPEFSSWFLDVCVNISLAILTVAFFLIVVRIVRGPTLPDRVVALDMLVAVGIGFIAAIGVQTDYFLYLDIAIALGLVGFLATVAFARFVLNRGLAKDATIVDEVQDSIARRESGQ
ncbi:cation:proton antiporter [Stappia taiwanensis]|uniref:Cation:proton antiporter n=1 Tax=Stappia taiwanensis TaxID=992267 RepID=A0A838XK32_9HYPH|nr:cation:proton antiporter [Stappia taiwanensis]MBA4610895.1 cation:proton antiporter [Stappia taiwanensis]GGE95039.1 cation:proton antiporter [Stappia taiwanensis]